MLLLDSSSLSPSAFASARIRCFSSCCGVAEGTETRKDEPGPRPAGTLAVTRWPEGAVTTSFWPSFQFCGTTDCTTVGRGCCGDCCTHLCCYSCAVGQEYLDLKKRLEPPQQGMMGGVMMSQPGAVIMR